MSQLTLWEMRPFGSAAIAGRRVVDRYDVAGAGPAGGSAKRFERWLDRWRAPAAAGRARVLVAADYSHVVVVLVDEQVEAALAVRFLHGRGVEHVDAGTGRTACGLELVVELGRGVVDVQLVLAGGRRCRWCTIALDSRDVRLEAAA